MEIGEIENKERLDLKSQHGTTSIINIIMNQKTIPMFNKYPTYKDSRVEWLGEIPEHWETRKGKFLFNKEERSVRDYDDVVTCFRDGEVTLRTNRRVDGFTNALKEHGYQGVRRGDLVIHAMDAFAGAIGVSDSDGKSTPVYSVCTPRIENKVNPYYYAYFLRNMAKNNIILSLAKGIRERSIDFRFKDFGELNIVFPPIEEQTTITTFLDNKSAKIDHVIAQKEKMIALLKERKQIIIQDLVTGKKVWNDALNTWTIPAEVKDSGVEWIGEIPAHWKVLPGLRFFKENKRSNNGMKESTVLSLSYGKIIIKRKEKLIGLVPESFETYQIVIPGDIVVRCTDLQNDQTSLRTGLAKDKGIITSAYINLGVLGDNHPEYLHAYLHFIDITKVLYKFGSGLRQNLGFSDFKRMPILYVPIEEQTVIVSHIETQSAKIDKAITLQEQQIAKLKELKSTLIDSAVMGKIKV
jgi:type I restriction enzyme S subunit